MGLYTWKYESIVKSDIAEAFPDLNWYMKLLFKLPLHILKR